MSTTTASKPSTAPALGQPAYRDIAVAVMDMPADGAALAAAAALARNHGAELDVLQVLPMPLPAVDAWALIPDPSLTERYAELRAAAAKHTTELERRLPTLGVQGRVQVLEAFYESPTSVLAAAARRTDISVLARPVNAPASTARVHAQFAGLLLESGRPVIVVPAELDTPCLPPRHVTIAWADTSESARAVHDALPLLRTAESVDVVMVDPVASQLEEAGAFGDALAAHLKRHGVSTRLHVEKSRGRHVSRVILDRASRSRAHLIVAGGYGHSRLREWVVGGTTRALFHDSPVPLFFSH